MSKCKMCGMEIAPTIKRYAGKKNVKQNKDFCDKLCLGYFMKRVYADEFNKPLKE